MALFDLQRMHEYNRTSLREKVRNPVALTASSAAPFTYNEAPGVVRALDQNAFAAAPGSVPQNVTIDAAGLITYTGARVRRPVFRATMTMTPSGAGAIFFGVFLNGARVTDSEQLVRGASNWVSPVSVDWAFRFLRTGDTLQLYYTYPSAPAKTVTVGPAVITFGLR